MENPAIPITYPKPMDLRDYQEQILVQSQELLRQEPSLMVTAPTGAGKCHPAGTQTLMYDGSFKKVQDIREGDLLMGPDSRPRTVTSISMGFGKIFQVRQEDTSTWECNDEHLLTLLTPSCRIIDTPVSQFLQLSQKQQESHRLIRPH